MHRSSRHQKFPVVSQPDWEANIQVSWQEVDSTTPVQVVINPNTQQVEPAQQKL